MTEQDNTAIELLRYKINLRIGECVDDGHTQSCGEFQTVIDEVMQLIQQHTEAAVREARIDELRDYPLNWADNRKDTVWREMILSRIKQLTPKEITK